MDKLNLIPLVMITLALVALYFVTKIKDDE
jgi:hypothetical protein